MISHLVPPVCYDHSKVSGTDLQIGVMKSSFTDYQIFTFSNTLKWVCKTFLAFQ